MTQPPVAVVPFWFVRRHYAIDMSSTFTLSTKSWFAVGLVAYLLAAFAFLTGEFLLAITAFSTGGIAAFDSTHIQLRRYRTWVAYGPVGVFMVCSLIWPFALIWYFIVRVRVARGTMPFRDDFRPRHNAA